MKEASAARVVAHYLGGEEGLPGGVRKALEAFGIQLHAAPDRRLLRKLVAAVPADLLLASSDAIPDAKRAIPALRRLYGLQGLPLIVLAAGSPPENFAADTMTAGADDVLLAPVPPTLLAARIDAALRTAEQLSAPTRLPSGILRTSDGEITVDLRRHLCLVREAAQTREVLLTRKQFSALAAFLKAAGRPVRWQDLYQRGWRPGKLRLRSRTLVQHVIVLRRKLGAAGRRIVSMPGIGYRIAP